MSNSELADSKTRFFVRVYKEGSIACNVGPFESLNDSFRAIPGAMEWLYQQIGLLKTHYPEEKLVKERWNYQKGDSFMKEDVADIKVNFAEFSFELFTLKPPKYSNVVEELIQDNEFPEWAQD